MDHGLKCKHKTIKLVKKNRIKLSGFRARQRVLRFDTNITIHERKNW